MSREILCYALESAHQREQFKIKKEQEKQRMKEYFWTVLISKNVHWPFQHLYQMDKNKNMSGISWANMKRQVVSHRLCHFLVSYTIVP